MESVQATVDWIFDNARKAAVDLADSEAVRAAVEWVKENTGKIAAIGCGIVLIAAPMFVTTPAPAAAGFGAEGPIAGM